jgi:predicted dehydrogenase
VDVPELASRGDRAEADRWRDGRRTARSALGRSAGRQRVALATDGRSADTGPALVAAGAELVGLLAPEPLESLAWAAAAGAPKAYPDLASLLADEVEVLCVDLDLPSGGALARAGVHAGLNVLLNRPGPVDAPVLHELLEGAQNFDVVVTAALAVRAWPSLPAVAGLVGTLGALRQVTVVGWPIGRAQRGELADLVRQLCGDVLAVCAAPGSMPAADLRPGEPVTLALLTDSGATVLAAERPVADASGAAVTMVGTDGRLMFGPEFVRRQDARGVASSSTPDDLGPSPLAVALNGLVEGANGATASGAGDGSLVGRAATTGDLLAAARVLDLAASSFDTGGWLET